MNDSHTVNEAADSATPASSPATMADSTSQAPSSKQTPSSKQAPSGKQTPSSKQTQDASLAFANTNKWDTRTLVTMALLCAIGVLLSFIETPAIFAPFLRLDVSHTPAMVAGFAFGGGAGVLVGVVTAIAHGALDGNWVGALMNSIVAAAFIFPAAAIYNRNRTMNTAIIGLVVSVVVMVVVAIIANLIIDPLFYGYPFDAVVALIVPALIPFNLLKGLVNSILTVVVYKSIKNLITPKKEQIVGR